MALSLKQVKRKKKVNEETKTPVKKPWSEDKPVEENPSFAEKFLEKEKTRYLYQQEEAFQRGNLKETAEFLKELLT